MSIRTDTNQLGALMNALEQRLAEIRADQGMSGDQRVTATAEVTAAAVSQAQSLIEGLWGVSAPGERLAGGSVWTALEAADRRIGTSRGAGDQNMSWAGLAYASAHLIGRFPQARNLDEIRELYAKLSPIEQRAAQDLAARGFFLRRFAAEPGIASFTAELERDREAASSPDLAAREREKAELVGDIAEAWKASKGAERILDVQALAGIGIGPIGRTLAGVLAEQKVVPVTTGELEAGVYWRFSRRSVVSIPPGAEFLNVG